MDKKLKEPKKGRVRAWFQAHKPTKRRLIQLYAALLTNANLKGFASGNIYKGSTKYVCTPGLNCYSCPGAIGACPMGALQNSLASSGKTAAYYMFGIILLYGILFGRWICGFLCPFGLVQDLLHKIPTPKLKKSKVTRILSYFKYVVLVLFVFVIPLVYMLKDMPLPAFCKYICPAGTLGGALAMLVNPLKEDMFSMLGPLFTWKFVLLVCFVVASVFIYRFFCRFFCPLGALYGLFNRFAIIGIKLDKPSCTDCGLCQAKCKMDIRHVADHECINCGECISVCPTNAIQWKGKKIILPDNEIPADAAPEVAERIEKKRGKRKLVTQIVAAALCVSVLTGALVYYNVVDKETVVDLGGGGGGGEENPDAPTGNKVGNTIPDYELRFVEGMGEGKLKLSDYRGKVVVLNFWGTWCTGCVAELPAFNRIASDYYDDDVVVITVHTAYIEHTAKDYIDANFPGSKMIFTLDDPLNDYEDVYYTMLGGSGNYPMTLIMDANGVITMKTGEGMSYEKLESEILKAID